MQNLASSLLGLGNGGTYAALALALVLIYRSSGVLNFAVGAQALLGAYIYANLREGELLLIFPGLPRSVSLGAPLGTGPALFLALLISAAFGGLLYIVVFRPLRNTPQLARAVASLAVLIAIQTVITNRLGTDPVSVDAIYPSNRWTWQSMTVLSDRIYLALTVVAMTLAITALYRWTRFGLLTRATADSEAGAFVSGISPDRVALLNWVIGGAVAGAAGILIAPLAPVQPSTYTLFVVPALAAAVVGGFQHLVPTVIAGIGIGMLQAWLVYLPGHVSWIPRSGTAELVPLVVMLVALVITGRAVPVRGTVLKAPLGRAPRPRSTVVPLLLGVVVGTLALVVTHGSARAAVIGTLIGGMITLSLVVVTGYAGQVSLAQLALAGVGAFTLSTVTTSWGVPFPLAPLLAALVATVVGVIIGLPALRVRGLTLGVVTLALAYGIEALWFRNSEIVASFGAVVEQPKLFGIDLGIGVGKEFPRLPFALMVLVFFLAVAWGVARLRTSSLGSAMLAVRANERSAAGIGVNVVYIKVISFAIASFIAGLGGALLAYRRGVVTWESFAALAGLAIVSTAYLAGVTSVAGGVLAGVLVAGGVIVFVTDKWIDLGDWLPLVTSVALVVTLNRNPEGLAAGLHGLGHKLYKLPLLNRVGRKAPVDAAAPSPEHPEPSAPVRVPVPARQAPTADTPIALAVTNLTVHYGGVVAVSDVSLRVPEGAIVGLVGPNGAGKTSVIDAITGYAKAGGTVELDGQRIDDLRTHQRVRRGLGRTFQSLDLYDDMTVDENVSAAAFGLKGGERHGAVQRSLDLVGIGDHRETDAANLSHGQRQLVSIARACAGNPQVLLLDEPAAGLDTNETKWLGDRIRAISAAGTGVLLIDHDVAMVLAVCDYVYVLDFGAVIAEGDPASIRSNQAVADAYLGNRHNESAELA